MAAIRVLIVEDQGITALDTVDIMRELGHEVTGIVMTGESAIQMAGRDRPDVVLMDILLAGQMTGKEAALNIWQMYQIPVIYLTAVGSKRPPTATGNTSDANVGNHTVPEGFGYIVKPYSKEDLKREIERLVT